MERTPLYVNTEGIDNLSLQVIASMQNFGKDILSRDFQPTPWPKDMPNLRDFEKNGTIRVDAYKQALWNLYNAHGETPLFTADVTEGILVPSRFHSKVDATSAQYCDIHKDNFELIMPDKAGVIVSRAGFNPDNRADQAMVYFLSAHEMGHLALGDKACNSDSCIFSHNYGALPKILEQLLTNGKMPICDFDRKRIKEFRERWGIK